MKSALLRSLSEFSRLSGFSGFSGFKQSSGAAVHGNSAFAALIWWLVPLFAVTGAILYVIWVSRFKDKFENETNRSVSTFQSFQRSFDGSVGNSGARGSVRPVRASGTHLPTSDHQNRDSEGAS